MSVRIRNKKHINERLELVSDRLISVEEIDGISAVGGKILEIGSGKGGFVIGMAQLEPDKIFVAIEREENVMISALERAVELNIQNIYFVLADADNLINLDPMPKFERIYLNFSDPWRKNTHSRRRLTSQKYLELYSRILAADGEIHLKTDNKDFFEFSLRELPKGGFLLAEVFYDLHENGVVGVLTEYETNFMKQGKPILKLIARKNQKAEV